MVFGILGIASIITLDAYGHAQERNSTECFLINATDRDIDVSSGFITVPYTFSAISEMLVYIASKLCWRMCNSFSCCDTLENNINK